MSQLSNNSELLQSLLTRVEDLPFNVDTTLPIVKTLEPFIVPMVDEDGNQIIQSGEEKSIIVNPIHLEAHYVENPETGLLTQYLTAKIYSNTDGIIESKNNYIYISGGSISGSNPEDPNIPSLIIYPSDLIGGVSGSALQKSFGEVFSDNLFSMDMYQISSVATISGEHKFYIGSNCMNNPAITQIKAGDSMGINPNCYDNEIISNGRILYPYGAIMTSIPAISGGSDTIDLVPRDETNKDVPLLICDVNSQNPMAFYSSIRGYGKAVQVKLNDLSIFGNAKPEDVAKNKTFTAADGAVIEGTMPIKIGQFSSQGEYMGPTQESFIFYSTFTDEKTIIDPTHESNIVQIAIDKNSFGDVDASEVPVGKTFTSAKGYAQEGKMPIRYAPFETVGTFQQEDETDYLFHSTLPIDGAVMIASYYSSDNVYMSIDKSSFGDAGPTDVKAGKTFTSSKGVKIKGVAQMSPTDYISQTGTFTFNSSGKASIPITEKTLNNGGLVYYFTATAPSPFGRGYTDSFKIINGKVTSDIRCNQESHGSATIIVPSSTNGINVSGQGLSQSSYKFSSKTFNTSQRWTYTLRGISFDSL